MRSLVGGAIAVVFAMLGAPASAAHITVATPGYTYYHRAGADLAGHDKALDHCLQQTATTAHALRGPVTGIGMGILDQLVEAEINKSRDVRVEDRGFAANLENCMVATGWTVRVLPESEGRRLSALPAAELHQNLAAMVGAETPPGQLARRFDNDILNPDTSWLREPGAYDKLPLDLVARGDTDWRVVRLAAKPPPPPPLSTPDFAAPQGTPPLDPGRWNSLPEGTTAVLITVARVQKFLDEPVLIFMRESADVVTPAWYRDGKMDVLRVGMGFNTKVRMGRLIETTYLLPLPAGRWRLMGVQSGRVVTSFCLGAPGFVLEEGSVTWMGRFAHGETPQLAPDLDKAVAQRVTAGAPDLYRRLQPARWENGSRFGCDGSFIYAFEIPGAPTRAALAP